MFATRGATTIRSAAMTQQQPSPVRLVQAAAKMFIFNTIKATQD